MTDTPDGRAHPSEPQSAAGEKGELRPRSTPGGAAGTPNGSGRAFAPAAHAHPIRASAAVLDSRPASPGAFGWPASSTSSADPPPFGFNAPQRGERGGALPDSDAAPAATTAGARPDGPAVARPLAPPATQPRELMPAASVPMEERRLGESITPTFGPPGKHRSPAAMVLFSVLTLGVYAIVWHRRVNQEMGDFDPRIHVHPSQSAWAVFIPWCAGLLGSAAAAGMVLAGHYGLDLHLPVTGRQVLPGVGALAAVQYLVLLLPFSLIAVVRTAERVRMVEEHAGVTTDEQIRPAALAGWLLLPVIGGFVLMGRQQGNLNRIWDLARE